MELLPHAYAHTSMLQVLVNYADLKSEQKGFTVFNNHIADALVTDISQTAVSFTEVSLLPLLAQKEPGGENAL